MKAARTTRAGLLTVLAGVMLIALGIPAAASTGQPGPPVPRVGDPVTFKAEVQSIVIANGPATGGTWSLTVAGNTRTGLAFNIRDTALKTEIETGLNAGVGGTNNVTITAIRGVSYLVSFDMVANTPGGAVAQMTAASSLTGTLAPYAITVGTVQDATGAAITTQAAPHGGFSSVTNYCIQCHAVHSYQTGVGTYTGGYGYALLQRSSVTATCNTCHSLFGSPNTGVVDSNTIVGKPAVVGAPNGGMGSASLRTAYDLAGPGGTIPVGVAGHGIGTPTSPLPDDVTMNQIGWSYGSFSAAPWFADVEEAGAGTASPTDGGLYCGSCHTPHGEFGQLINSGVAGAGGALGSGNPGYRSNPNNVGTNAVQYIDAREVSGAGEFYRLKVFDPALGFAVDDPAGYVTITGDLTDTSTAAVVDSALDGVLTGGGQVTVVYAQSPSGSPSTAIGAATWATRFYRVTFSGANVDLFTMPQMEPVDGSIPASPNNVPEKVEVITGMGGAPATTISAPSTPGSPATGPSSNSANGTIAAGPRPWVEGAPIFQYKGSSASPTVFYLHLDTDGVAPGSTASVWEKCDQTTTGAAQAVTGVPNAVDTVAYGTCSLLTTADSEGQTVSLYGYKLLSAYPNHNYLSAESWGVAYRATDQARWCGTCHPSKVGEGMGVEGEFSVDVGGVPTVFHSHPTACNYCHGSPADGSSADFPHTSTKGVLLKEYPDALCLSCHTQGTLP